MAKLALVLHKGWFQKSQKGHKSQKEHFSACYRINALQSGVKACNISPSWYLKYLKNKRCYWYIQASWKFKEDNLNYSEVLIFPFFSRMWPMKLQPPGLPYGTFCKLCEFLYDILPLTMELVQLVLHCPPAENVLVICQFSRPRATKPLWEWESHTITESFLSWVPVPCTRTSFLLCMNKLEEH